MSLRNSKIKKVTLKKKETSVDLVCARMCVRKERERDRSIIVYFTVNMNQVCSFIYYRTTIIIGVLFFFIGDDVFVDWEEEPLAPDDNKSLLTNNDGLSTI